ncbi:unnamed protein product, partial [Mesorhabditis belari]|uniref:Rhodanese domain-containing protein n=1 Tax=Mesorhabditis belari TaxID=2138241 RepID=A0AAF3FI40_9BILA
MSVYRRGLAEIGINRTPLPNRSKPATLKANINSEEKLKNSADSTTLSTVPEIDYSSRVDDDHYYMLKSPYQLKTPVIRESTPKKMELLQDEEPIERFDGVDDDGRFHLEEFARPAPVLKATLTQYVGNAEPIERFGGTDEDDGRFHFDEPFGDCPVLLERDYGMDQNLSKADVERYSRQLLVHEFGVNGQKELKAARVLVVGAGGLGCPTAMYLAGAGVGTLGIADFDMVSKDNLHRQVAHSETLVGKLKVDSLKQSILSNIAVRTFSTVLNGAQTMDIAKDFDVVADCSDNAATRYMLNDVCVFLNKPLVSGSALRWEGQLTVYNYGEDGPCYRCLFPHPPAAHLVTNCSEGGQKDCAVCGEAPTIHAPIDYEVFCGSGVVDKNPSLSLLDPNERVSVSEYSTARKSPTILVDTRPKHEFAIASLPEARNIPMDSLKQLEDIELRKLLGLSEAADVFVICHRGNDSQLAVRLIQERFKSEIESNGFQVKDIVGGYDRWAEEIDQEFPRY